MPKATAIWLIDNTTLTFEQIGEFCGLHPLEIQAIADGEAAIGLLGHDPLTTGELTLDEIARCEADSSARLRLSEKQKTDKPKKGAKYTPLILRQAKPDAVAWLLKEIPDIKDSEIIRLIGTTRATIQSIRDKSHRHFNDLKPQNPAHLGLASYEDVVALVEKYSQ